MGMGASPPVEAHGQYGLRSPPSRCEKNASKASKTRQELLLSGSTCNAGCVRPAPQGPGERRWYHERAVDSSSR